MENKVKDIPILFPNRCPLKDEGAPRPHEAEEADEDDDGAHPELNRIARESGSSLQMALTPEASVCRRSTGKLGIAVQPPPAWVLLDSIFANAARGRDNDGRIFFVALDIH